MNDSRVVRLLLAICACSLAACTPSSAAERALEDQTPEVEKSRAATSAEPQDPYAFHALDVPGDAQGSSLMQVSALNAAHGLRVTLGLDHTTLDASGLWRLEPEFARVGHEGSERTAPSARAITQVDARTVVRHRGWVDEVLVNSPAGVEQTFVVHQEPGGKRHESAPLVVELAFAGPQSARMRGPETIDFIGPHRHTLRYETLRAWDASGRALPAVMRARDGEHDENLPRLALLVDDRMAEYPVTIDPTYKEATQRLIVDNLRPSDTVGSAIDVSGEVFVVGNPNDDTRAVDHGAVHIFLPSGNAAEEWLSLASPLYGDDRAAARFGVSVSLDGPLLAIGAEGDSEAAMGAGAVYLFEQDPVQPEVWTLFKKILAPATPSLGFGRTVALSGDILVVGAPRDDTGATNSGSIVVHARNEGGADNWGRVTTLREVPSIEDGRLGDAIAVSGNTIAAGSSRFDGGERDGGRVLLFRRNQGGPDNWGLTTTLSPPTLTQDGRFGYALDMDGDLLAIGAQQDGMNAGGAISVHRKDQGGVGTWGRVTRLTLPAGATLSRRERAISVLDDATQNGFVAVGSEDISLSDLRVGGVLIFGEDVDGAAAWGTAAQIFNNEGMETSATGASVALSSYTATLMDEMGQPRTELRQLMAMGAPLSDTQQNPDGGTVYHTFFTMPPRALDDQVEVPRFGFLDIDVLANDQRVPADLETVGLSAVTMPQNGTLVVRPNSTFRYTPSGMFSGDDTFVYEVTYTNSDASSGRATVTVTVAALSCVQTSDCPPGLVCSSSGDICVADPCLQDPTICPADQTCYRGSCFASCAGGATCNDPMDLCYDSNRCARSACDGVQCGMGEVCYEGTCFQSCAGGVMCEDPDDTCYDDTRCAMDACEGVQCATGQVCYEGSCFATCDASTACDDPNDTCFEASRCAMDACEGVQCGTGEVCYEGTCFQSCAGGATCTNPLDTCYDESRCAMDACEGVQCAPGSVCYEGTCFQSCAGGVMCEDPNDTCFDSTRCAMSACEGVQCGSAEVCYEGTCFESCAGGAMCSDPNDTCFDDQRCAMSACEGVQCEPKEVCYEGTCFESCAGGAMCSDPMATCYDDQRCAVDACSGVQCASAQICYEGTCFESCAGGAMCSDPNDTCFDDQRCAMDSCEGVQCGGGGSCLAGACRTPGGGPPVTLPGGGGQEGCCTSIPAERPVEGLVLAGLLALVGARRRRRAP